jgi:hypothetical protein
VDAKAVEAEVAELLGIEPVLAEVEERGSNASGRSPAGSTRCTSTGSETARPCMKNISSNGSRSARQIAFSGR